MICEMVLALSRDTNVGNLLTENVGKKGINDVPLQNLLLIICFEISVVSLPP
jgi:hypothetical protein